MNLVLDSRWLVATILEACDPQKPFPAGSQNLVAPGRVWEGVLHQSKQTGVDEIWWYASIKNGKLDKYSLNAARAGVHWVIEVGDQERLANMPWVLKEKAGREP